MWHIHEEKIEEVYFELYTSMNIKVNEFNSNSISMILIFWGVTKNNAIDLAMK